MLLTKRLMMSRRMGDALDYDPYWDDVVLLLKGEGSDGSTNIIDSSVNNHPMTVHGNAQISTAQSVYPDGSSMYFDGTNSYLSLSPPTEIFDLGINNKPFTFETWVYSDFFTTRAVFSAGGGHPGWNTTNGHQFLFFQEYQNKMYVQWFNGSSASTLDFPLSAISMNAWQHLCIVYGTDRYVRVYVNGSLVVSSTGPRTFAKPSLSNRVHVGESPSLGNLFNGYIDELRVTKGVARYTANFTPPTAPFPTTGP